MIRLIGKGRIGIAAMMMLVILPAAAFAQALTDKVPSDALVYVGWAGTSGAADAYNNSRLKAVLENTDGQKLFTETLPALARRVGSEDAQAGEVISLISTIAQRVWHHPTAFYWQGVDLTNANRPIPKFALVCDAGDDAASLAKDLQSALDRAGHSEIPTKVTTEGTTVSLLVGPVNPAAGQANLSTDQQFKEALGQVQANPVATVYVNIAGIIKMIDNAAPQGQPREKWTAIRDALGLNSATVAVWTGGFDGKDWSEKAFIAAPSPRTGIFSFLDSKPVTEDLLKLIPESASLVSARSFNAAAMLQDIRTGAAKVDPQAPQKIDQALQQFQSMTGLDLQNDVLAPLGDQWAAFTSPDVAGNNGVCLMNKLSDPAKAQTNLTRLGESVSHLMAGMLNKQRMHLDVRQYKYKDLTITYLAAPMIRPSWAIKDGVLYVGAYPQVVAAAVEAASATAGNGKSILQSDSFTSLRKRLGDHPMTSVGYLDLPRTVPEMYAAYLTISGYLGFADLYGAPTPAMLIPPLNDVLAQLTPAGSITWLDEHGWHAQGVSPFPGATAMGTNALIGVGAAALVTSIMLPSLNRARETANRVKCASNERQIGQAILLYSNDHRGAYPPDLGTLIKTEDITPEVFVCPSSNNSVPPAIRVASKDAQAQWVNQHSNYIYVGKGMNNTVGAETVVLYEKAADHDNDGMNLLFGDGHVEWNTMPMAQQQINKPQAPGGQPAGQSPPGL